MKRFLLLAALLLPLVPAWAQQTIVGSIRFGGLVRDYRLYVPKAYTGTGAVPLLLNLHGYGSNYLEQEFYGDFRPIADTANFLVVHPNGTLDATGKRYWNVFLPAGSGGPDDVAFLTALVDSINRKYPVDRRRVYSTGMSNGGFMSYELACQRSQMFAAIASVTGSMTASHLTACAPSRAVPVLEIHGTADGTVPYNGNAAFVPIPDLVAAWVKRNGCTTTPTVTTLPNLSTTDGSTVERQVYGGGRDGSVVEHLRVVGGGHTWPGAAFTIGVTNQDISASREVWRFLRQFRLPQLTTATRPGTAAELVVAPNPGRGWVQVRVAGRALTPAQVRVTDALGRAVPTPVRPAADGSLRLDTRTWVPGVYWLRTTVNGQELRRRVLKQPD